MCAPNANLIARDPAIPGLAVLLDGPAFAAALRAALPNAGILAIAPRYIRYKPGANCTVAYTLTTTAGDLPVYARAYAAPLRGKLDHARRLAERPGPLGPAACVLAPLDSALYSWPHDHELPALRRIADARKRRKLLAAVAPDHPALHNATLQTLRYKPERRYVGLLEAPDGTRAILRLYAPDEYAAARRAALATPSPHMPCVRTQRAASLRLALTTPATPATSSASLTSSTSSTPATSATSATPATPRLLAADDATHMLLLEWLPGQTLSALLATQPDNTAAIHAAGAALAALHHSTPSDLPPHDPLAALDAAVAAIAAVAPAEAPRAAELAEAISAVLRLTDTPRRLIHGDLYADQVLVQESGLAVIDWDNAALGDPAADLGSWIAHSYRATGDRATTGAQAHALLGGYRAAGGEAAAIEAHIAANLLRLAVEPFRYCAPDWPARLRRLIDCAEECLHDVSLAV